jgi:hypothetical protein
VILAKGGRFLVERAPPSAAFLGLVLMAVGDGPASAQEVEPTPAQCRVYGLAQGRGGDTQVFAAHLPQGTDDDVGDLHPRADLEGIAVHPKTHVLHAVSGQQGASRNRLYRVDADTGELLSVGATGFDQVRALAFRPTDATLWAWSSEGLLRIDPETGAGTLRFAAERALDALAWSLDGFTLYGLHGRDLFAFDPVGRTLRRLAARLPERASAMTMRPDGKLLVAFEPDGALEALGVFDPVSGELAVTFPVPFPRENVRGITWPLGCGNPSPGGPAPLIIDARLDKSVVCPTESVEVAVDTAVHPEGEPNPVLVDVNGRPGDHVFLQFPGAPGPRFVEVAAKTFEGYFDSRTLTLDVIECDDPEDVLPIVLLGPNPFDARTVDFHVANPEDFGDGASYLFDFGDGSTVERTVPYAAHTYLLGDLERDLPYTVFEASVTVRVGGEPDRTTPKTVGIFSEYAFAKRRGVIQPPVTFSERMRRSGSSYVASWRATNLEDQRIVFTSRQYEKQFCDRDREPELEPPVGTSIVIDPQETLSSTITRAAADLPDEVCGLGVHFNGATRMAVLDPAPGGSRTVDGAPARADLYFTVRDVSAGLVSDPAVLETLNRVASEGLVPDPDRITNRQLYALAAEGTIEYPAPGPAGAEGLGILQAEGEPCDPQVPPADPDLVCAPTDEWEEVPAFLANALKGELVLSTACGTIAQMLQNVDPPQYYEHEGIMTRNFDEIAHNTQKEKWLLNHIEFRLFDTLRFEPDALQHAWPGTLSQTIENAFLDEKFRSEGVDYTINSFNENPQECGRDRRVFRPLVLKPGAAELAEWGEELHAAADNARDLATGLGVIGDFFVEGAHYRFFAYTDGSISFDRDHDFERNPDTLGASMAAQSSSFLWTVLANAGVVLEGGALESLDEQNGAVILATTPDGLYEYDESERRSAARFLSADTFFRAAEELGELYDLHAEDSTALSNQIANCYAFDSCGEAATESFGWDFPGPGTTVSPEDMMFWDPYPRQENAIFRDGIRKRVYRLVEAAGFTNVSGTVFDAAGSPVEAATVLLDGIEEFITAADGMYLFENVPATAVCISAERQIEGNVFFDDAFRQLEAGVDEVVDLVLQPSETRRVRMVGTWTAIDDEDPFANEIEHGAFDEEVTLDPGNRFVSLELVDQCTGAEVNTRLQVDLTLGGDDVTVEARVQAQLWEQTDCSKSQSEDHSDETRPIGNDETQTFQIRLVNFGHGDAFNVDMEISNSEEPTECTEL